MIYKKGFTLIEIIVVIAVLTVIISFGTVVDFSSFTSSTFQDEELKIIALLQKARSRGMSNIFESAHGVCYSSGNYILFRGNTCDTLSTEIITANTKISEVSDFSTSFPVVVFNQLTGNTTGATIHIADGIKTADITINNEGTINW